MDLKDVVVAAICATVLTWTGLAVADEHHPGDFLHLDPSKALLSPTPLGPRQYFAPGPLDATVDRGSEGAQAAADSNPEPRKVGTQKIEVQKAEVQRAEPKTVRKAVGREARVMHARAEKPRGAARVKLARRHSNPLDAQAFDTRIQVWPCKSGGICGWKR